MAIVGVTDDGRGERGDVLMLLSLVVVVECVCVNTCSKKAVKLYSIQISV